MKYLGTTPARQKHALILAHLGGIGGTQRVVLDLTRTLRARGHHITTLLPDMPAAIKTRDWFSTEGVEVLLDRAVPDYHRAALPARDHISGLRALFRRHRPDVVNFHFPTRRISFKDLLAARLAGVPRIVVTVQHPSPFPKRGRAERWSVRASAVLCNSIVVSTPYTGDLLKSARIPDRVLQTIPLGVPPPRIHWSREQARHKLGIKEEDFVMLAVARMAPEKGIETLLASFERVSAPHKMLLVVGDGPLREQFVQIAARVDSERIRFAGQVPDTAPYYAAADLFTLPSEGEGFGLVFAEAAFHGLPSVAAGVWGVPYVIEQEETGLLVPPGDPESLARAISRLASNRELLRRMGAAAQTRAANEFTAERMASRYEALLFH